MITNSIRYKRSIYWGKGEENNGSLMGEKGVAGQTRV